MPCGNQSSVIPGADFGCSGQKPLGLVVMHSSKLSWVYLEPAFLNTPMMNNRQVAAERMREYDLWRQRALNAIRTYEEKAPGPEFVAEIVLEIIAHDRPRLRYVIGGQAKSITRLRRFLPEGVYEQGARHNFWLDKHQGEAP